MSAPTERAPDGGADLEAIREALAATEATAPGPWFVLRFAKIHSHDGIGPNVLGGNMRQQWAHARLIALLRNSAPALLALVDAQRVELERLRAALYAAMSLVDGTEWWTPAHPALAKVRAALTHPDSEAR